MKTYAKLLRAGILVPVGGTIPIVLYVLFGPASGNPIGLGLLAWASWLAGAVLLIAGFVGYVRRDE